MSASESLLAAAATLREAVDSLSFSTPVTHVYNPLDYAWEAHKLYLTKYADSTKKVVLLGMNPGGCGPFLPLQANLLDSSLLFISPIPG